MNIFILFLLIGALLIYFDFSFWDIFNFWEIITLSAIITAILSICFKLF